MTPHPEDLVTPDPCNSFELSSDGTSQQPANPKNFSLLSQAQALVQLMRYEGCIPIDAPVVIVDEPYTVAATRIVYGNDGRKIYGIHWQEPDAADLQNPFTFDLNAGQLLFELKNYIPGFGDWKKNREAGDVERVGLEGPINNAVGRPGTTITT